jgi:hypothetical protein
VAGCCEHDNERSEFSDEGRLPFNLGAAVVRFYCV